MSVHKSNAGFTLCSSSAKYGGWTKKLCFRKLKQPSRARARAFIGPTPPPTRGVTDALSAAAPTRHMQRVSVTPTIYGSATANRSMRPSVTRGREEAEHQPVASAISPPILRVVGRCARDITGSAVKTLSAAVVWRRWGVSVGAVGVSFRTMFTTSIIERMTKTLRFQICSPPKASKPSWTKSPSAICSAPIAIASSTGANNLKTDFGGSYG